MLNIKKYNRIKYKSINIKAIYCIILDRKKLFLTIKTFSKVLDWYFFQLIIVIPFFSKKKWNDSAITSKGWFCVNLKNRYMKRIWDWITQYM